MDWFGVEDFSFFEVESPFPVERRPIHWIPTLRMSRSTEEAGFPRLMKRIDDLIRSRPGRKGIIHTVSFARAKKIVEMSDHANLMDLNTSASTSSVVDRFKRDPRPRILVSPSIDTGFDFPYRTADWQIIAKVPFPVPTDPLVAARSLDDESYHAKIAASRLVQMTGRVMRAEDDMGETFILDDNVNFLFSRYKPFFPRWWREAYRRTGFVPPAQDVLDSGGPSPNKN
jgi:Rad3-related DNA helicase